MWRTWACLVVGCVLELGPVASGSLVGWWTLDEGTGTVAGDSSGNGLHGIFVGNPQWVPGMRGGALQFDGASWVDVGFSRKTDITGTLSIACWVYPDKLGAIVTQDRGLVGRDAAYSFKTSGDKIRITVPNPNGRDHTTANGTLRTGVWQHLAVTFVGSQAGGAVFYLNGVETDRVDTVALKSSDGMFRIGNSQWGNQIFMGAIDDVRLYDHVLSADEVKQLALRATAWEPSPADNAIGVSMPLLQWKPGGTALVHNVYVGTSPELTSADRSGSNLLVPMHYYGAGLQPGVTYYWRVDAIGADMVTVYQGDVWRFTAAPRQAWAPQPADGTRYVAPQVQLAWSPGAGALAHDLYFSTDRAAVEAGADSARVAPRPVQSSYTPEGLARGATYFWRVDEDSAAGKTPGMVWSFTARPVIAKRDPNLVGWWKLDDENSGTAVDSSGWDNYGTLQGPLWADGYLGDALAFDGVDDGVDCGTDASINNVTSVTVAAWIKLAGLGVDRKIASNQNNSSGGYKLGVYSSNKVEFEMRTSANASTHNRSTAGGTVFERDVWYHVAGVYSSGQFIRTYVNGRLDREALTSNVLGVSPGPLRLGRESFNTVNWWWGLLDDVRVYNKALTEEEVATLMQGDPVQASQPQPGNGTNADIRAATELSWSAGATAAQHDVYFGSDKDAVKAADTASPEYRGRQAGTSFSLDGLTAFGGGRYSWRIDEVEADGTTIHKGNLWQFNVPGLLIVDDFESYNDEESQGTRIYETWIDGYSDGSSGSIVGNINPPFAERIIVHGGRQAMPMDYNNINAPYYSEAYREFSPAENWTANGVANLSLWFRGHPQKMVETAPGRYLISSTSGDISGTVDNFRFVCKRLDGDGTIQAQVLGVTYTAPWAKAGVMINESLEPSSARAHMIITPSGRRAFENRPVAGAGSFSAYSATGLITPPYWVKLERKGNQITAYHSPDGVNWILQPDNENTNTATRSPNPQTFNMANTVYIGLLVTSNNLNAPCFGEFSDVTVTGSVSGSWRIVDIGPNRGNDTGQFYVALEDSNGKLATVKNGQADAVNALTWTEWQIPLTDFTGVNLNKVKRLWIGVGDKAATAPDGTGRIHIDDICLTTP